MNRKSYSANQFWGVFAGAFLLSILLSRIDDTHTIVLAAILILGVPHGALDIIMLKQLAHPKPSKINNARLFLYSAGYAITVIACLGTWRLSPAVCLCLFFCLAAVHFSSDWRLSAPQARGLISTLVLTAPALFHPESLHEQFTLLGLTDTDALSVITGMRLVCILVLISLLAMAHKLSVSTRVWILVLVSTCYLLPVLYFFSLYFCALHAPLHTLQIKVQNQLSWPSLAHATTAPLLGTGLILGGFFAYIPQGPTNDALLSTVFIGLFALTVPHLILTLVYQRLIEKQNT
ncbi:Brp/Blh family beta-carotene 15,15'-dioxygenase [Vibrio sp. WXL103]|uniref:Brp/Blh family beta-carotene 15,15'-dioxygenase n=1 Tax=Vibrio sp. WXL103 TaxID=3450710 RepID=UPI003EC75983